MVLTNLTCIDNAAYDIYMHLTGIKSEYERKVSDADVSQGIWNKLTFWK